MYYFATLTGSSWTGRGRCTRRGLVARVVFDWAMLICGAITHNPDAGEALSFTCEILKYAPSRTSSSLIPARTKTRSGSLYRKMCNCPIAASAVICNKLESNRALLRYEKMKNNIEEMRKVLSLDERNIYLCWRVCVRRLLRCFGNSSFCSRRISSYDVQASLCELDELTTSLSYAVHVWIVPSWSFRTLISLTTSSISLLYSRPIRSFK